MPLDAQNNSQTFCMEVVEFSWRDGCTQSMTRMHRAGRHTFSLVSWLIRRHYHTFFLSLPNAELDLERCLALDTSFEVQAGA